jgi:hypothetical protein
MLKVLSERIDIQTNVQLWRLALNSWLSIRAVSTAIFLHQQDLLVVNNNYDKKCNLCLILY